MKELAKKYNFKIVEENKYQYWLETGIFSSKNIDNKPVFSMILPPPNITGKLHLGHAWNNTLQDAVARYKRLQGFYVNWFPGMDHAGIATQIKVEEDILNKEKKQRSDFSRSEFVEKVFNWKKEYSEIIRQQWKILGLSLNYKEEKFTLDNDVNQLVINTFIKLYNDKLIYRGKKIINWDPKLKTALSNMEVDYKETKGKMYYIKYPIKDSNDFLIVATTRPETMFADKAIIFNPQDIRYQRYSNMQVINPSNNQLLPILSDDYIDMNFGTGLMKCTPSHDFNDYEIAMRHNLEFSICMTDDGTMNELAGKYEGLERFNCRKKLINDLEKQGLIVKIVDYVHQVGYSERSGVAVEPYLSEQWFIKMKPLVKKVLELQNSNEAVKFFPSRFIKVLEQWLENIQDWCISRQLWWGHRLPVWYNKTTNKIIVAKKPPNNEQWIQDNDVLDTWFSSGLWPLVLSKWNKDNKFFETYLPSSLIVTGYDIIFFWISRMMFQTLYLTNKKPFNQVLIHGLVRDMLGRKMSKSLGNGIDPLDVINEYGADSLRYFLLTNSSPGQDLKFNNVKIKAAWNFINKLWNASRYVLLNLPSDFNLVKDIMSLSLTPIDYWILDKLNFTLSKINNYINNYEFALLGNELWTFVWDQFCSWYIELSKINLENEQYRFNTIQVLFYTLKQILILLHPFIPFVSEDIYQNLVNGSQSIMQEEYPKILKNIQNVRYLNNMISIISVIRELRAEKNIKKTIMLKFNLKSDNLVYLQNQKEINIFLKKLTNSEIVSINKDKIVKNIISLPILDGIIDIELDNNIINNEENINVINKKIEEFEKELARSKKLLNNNHFLTKAPAKKVSEEKKRYEQFQKVYNELQEKLRNLQKK